ncbi:MAG: helix-turn-helix transcriptional regulator [Flavobacteriaceae bacterium]|jgi:transcriptional regulator with XRE-family HTH domain|nr:helix-turn-helix transcriptional regulator [Flavobacteriaceae bacterium]
MKNEIRLRIKELREYLGLTQTQFSEKIGGQQPNLSHMEKAGKKISIDIIYEIISKFNISPNWLVLGIGDMILSEDDNSINVGGCQKVGNNSPNATQIMHSNNILLNENESLKRENELLREMVDMLKSGNKK